MFGRLDEENGKVIGKFLNNIRPDFHVQLEDGVVRLDPSTRHDWTHANLILKYAIE